MVVRWSHINWPAVGYVSLEDVDAYRDHLARLTTDAPPQVAALAAVRWDGARFERWHHDAGARTLESAILARNDEVLDTDDGLYRRWNHARITLRFSDVTLEPGAVESDALLLGDVHISRGELAHAGADGWELRLLLSPLGELAVRFGDVALAFERTTGVDWDALEARPLHGWRGPLPDGWVEYAVPLVRAAACDDVGGLSLELDGVETDRGRVDDLDPRWGFAPLHAAAWFDRGGATELLIERGADVDLLDAEGRSALAIAAERHSSRAASLLRSAGALELHEAVPGVDPEGDPATQ